MKEDTGVKLYIQERRKRTSQRLMPAHVGISYRKDRGYDRRGSRPASATAPLSGRATLIPLSKTSLWVMT